MGFLQGFRVLVAIVLGAFLRTCALASAKRMKTAEVLEGCGNYWKPMTSNEKVTKGIEQALNTNETRWKVMK